MKGFFTGLAALSVLALGVGCSMNFNFRSPDTWVEETEEFDIPAANLARLECRTENGEIRIHAAEPGVTTIHVIARKRAGADDDAEAREALGCLHVARSESGEALVLEGEWTRSSRRGWNGAINFDVLVPAHFAATLHSDNGRIEVVGIAGALAATTHNGAVHLELSAPSVDAETHNGAIEYRGPAQHLELTSHNGAIRARLNGGAVDGRIGTNNGEVVIEAADTVRGTIRGETGNGRLALGPGSGATAQVDDHEFVVTFADPAAGCLHVETHNGAIRVN